MKQPGKQLKKVSTMFARRTQAITRDRGSEYISGAFAGIIAFLSENHDKPLYQKDIEREFGLSRSAVSRAISQMEEKGLILRLNSAEDCRLKELLLTEKAKAVSEQLFSTCLEVENELIKGFSAAELSTFCGYLTRMEQNLREAISNEAFSEKE